MKVTKSLNYLIFLPIVGVTSLLMSSEWLINKPLVTSVPPPLQAGYEQNPPYPVKFWIQKLSTAGRNGENLIFKVKYESDGALPATIDLYGNSVSVQYTLRDDGTYPDDISKDGKYACLKKEDLTSLLAEINATESRINLRGYVTHFNGHSGQIIQAADIVPFDLTKFQNNDEVEVSALLIDADECSNEINPEKSLFITDLSVVEDQTRTYNVATGVGNVAGVWTFGTLIANMENGQHTSGLKGFLKDWIKQWTTSQTVNGQVIVAREQVVEHLIAPWLRKAQNNPNLTVTSSNWETIWNSSATTATALKQTAPFKLTAIVNRMDLRGNSAYTQSVGNSGETRFIFTLINPYTGQIPINSDQPLNAQGDGVGLGDWRGLNVILEYGNVQSSKCDMLALAQSWLDLSDNAYSFGNAATNNAYKNALQQITNYVTAANSNTGKINGSAINRIRTNEKLFSNRDATISDAHLAWARMDWEFRQFELDPASHAFKMVPLTNNPPVVANAALNIDEDFSGTSQVVVNENLLAWIYGGNKLKVRHGNYNMPSYLLSGSALVTNEGAHYFDFDEENWMAASNSNDASAEAKEIRQQFSLNTCIGCHTGETKTRFTHINTLRYTESARYWLSALDGNNVIQDRGSYPFGGGINEIGGYNNGETIEPNIVGGVFKNYSVMGEFENENFFQAVSPFLTGRRFRTFTAIDGRPSTWQDDEGDDANIDGNYYELSDQGMEGLFYVADPSNRGTSGIFPLLHDKKWGYNDLLRRKNDLCTFLINGCNGVVGQQNNPSSMSLIRSIAFVSLPLASH